MHLNGHTTMISIGQYTIDHLVIMPATTIQAQRAATGNIAKTPSAALANTLHLGGLPLFPLRKGRMPKFTTPCTDSSKACISDSGSRAMTDAWTRPHMRREKKHLARRLIATRQSTPCAPFCGSLQGQCFIFGALCPSQSGLMNKHIVDIS